MPYKWTVTSGSLPPGTRINTQNSGRSGFLVGQPTTAGTYSWRITVEDDASPTPATAYADYTMTVSSSLYLTGFLIDDGGVLPQMTKNNPLDGQFLNRLYVHELGAQSSTFSTSVIEGTKPSWLTITTTSTTNVSPTGNYNVKYCFAAINFTGTPTTIGSTKFKIRVHSSSGAFQDLEITASVGDVRVTPVPVDTFYTLSATKTEITEGESVTIYLRTANYTEGSNIPYRIEGGPGFSAADINIPLTGNFTVTTVAEREPIFISVGGIFGGEPIGWNETVYQVGSITLTAAADLQTEGTEAFRIYLPGFIAQSRPEWTTYLDINIRDTSQAPVVPTYSLSASHPSISEGDVFSVTLTTTNVPQGTRVPYSITGVTSNDLYYAPLQGEFVIGAGGTATITYTTVPNQIVDPKTFRMNVPSLGLSVAVAIADANPTYALSSSATEVVEGRTVLFNLRTTTVADGTTFNYNITGVAQSDVDVPLNGTFTINGNLGGVSVTPTADLQTEGDETMTFSVPSVGKTLQLRIRDTSLTPARINYTMGLLKTNGTPLTASDTLNEGDKFFVVVDASVAAVGSGVRYSISGIEQSLISIPLSGEWRLYEREMFGSVSAWYAAEISTYSSGQTNVQRNVTISLPDVSLNAAFKLKSTSGVTQPPPPPPPPPAPPEQDPPPVSTTPIDVLSTPESFPEGTVGVDYAEIGGSRFFYYTGGAGGVTWNLISGSLPPGLALSPYYENAILFVNGSPTTAGTYTFTVRATDINGGTDTLQRSITIVAAQSNPGGPDPGSGGTLPNVPPGGIEDEIFDFAGIF